MHPRLLDFDRSHSGKDTSGWQVAVADHLPMTGLVAKVGTGIDPARYLRFDGRQGATFKRCVVAERKKVAYPAGVVKFFSSAGPTRAWRIRHERDYDIELWNSRAWST
jgi:hypothetical protein